MILTAVVYLILFYNKYYSIYDTNCNGGFKDSLDTQLIGCTCPNTVDAIKGLIRNVG